MATSKELRLKNLRALVAEFKTADAVAQRAGTAPMYLSQILTGAKSATGTVRGVGDTLARKLELGCGKDVGWMDRPHDLESAVELVPGAMLVRAGDSDDPALTQIMKVKLKVQAGITGFQVEPEHYEGDTHTVKTSWLRREGFAREALDTIIVNTRDTKLVSGVVYVVNYEGEAVVKRMIRDAGQWWLTSDNQDQVRYHRQLCKGAECIVIGRVVRKESTHI